MITDPENRSNEAFQVKRRKEVAQKLKAVLTELDKGQYVAPCKMTVAEWLDIWSDDYLGAVKPATVCAYRGTIKTHLKPGLGATRLDALDTQLIQTFYNGLIRPTKERKAVSPKTVKNIHGVLHKALQQALVNGYIRRNPTEGCVLPRVEKKQIKPIMKGMVIRNEQNKTHREHERIAAGSGGIRYPEDHGNLQGDGL